MSWNYRVIKTIIGGEESYGIHEVYYDEQGKPKMYSKDPVPAYGETLLELKEDMERLLKAFNTPILTEDDFNSTLQRE